MAECNATEHNDLKFALEEVPLYETGKKSFSDMAKAYFEKYVLSSKELDIPEAVKPFLEVLSGFFLSHLSFGKHMAKYFDKDPPFQLDETVLSGSWSEGLFFYDVSKLDPPDVDYLCILKNISFSEADQECGGLSLSENSPFVNVYISDINLLRMWQSYLVESASDALSGKICQLSSTKLKERLYENYSKEDRFLSGHCNPVTDSPALKLSVLSVSLFEGPFVERLLQTAMFNIWRNSDLVMAIRCDGWPQNALEWIHRERYWPPKDVIERVTKEGFYIVPKSSNEANFRLSFSSAERILVENLSKIQFKIFRAFKMVIKILLPSGLHCKEILRSYHLKTVGFWHLEKSAPETWSNDNIVSHFLQMLDELVQALRQKNLPMYFLKEYNLFSNVENLEDLKNLSDTVEEISRDIPGLKDAIENGSKFRFHYTDHSERIKNILMQIL